MAVAASTLISDALIEAGIIGAGQTPAANDSALGLRLLNRDIMDPWNAIKPFSMGSVLTTGTFAASTATRLIGPSGTGSFTVTPRPTTILSAQRVDTAANPDEYFPIRVHLYSDYPWRPIPLYSSTDITDLYYDPSATLPNGTMYAWPVPDATQTVRVETPAVMGTFATTATTLEFAPGYEAAIVKTLAELCCMAWHRPFPDGLRDEARKLRAIVQINNLRLERRRLYSDAPRSIGRIGSDIEGFRTRENV